MKEVSGYNLNKIETDILQGKYTDANNTLDKYLEDDLSIEDYIKCKILKSRIYYVTQPYSLALKNGLEALHKSQNIGNPYLIFDSAIWLQQIYIEIGRIEEAFEALELFKKALYSIEEKDDIEYLKRESFFLRSSRPYRDGFDVILSDLKKSYSISSQIGDENGQASALFLLGNLHSLFDRKPEAIRFYKECFTIANRMGDAELIMATLVNLAEVHTMLGNLEESYRLRINVMNAAKSMKYPFIKGINLLALGYYHWQVGDIKSTLNCYALSLTFFENAENTNHWHYSIALFNLALIYLEIGDLTKAIDCRDKLEKIKNNHDEHHISNRFFQLSDIIIQKHILFEGAEQSEFIKEKIEKSLEQISFAHFAIGESNKIALFHLCDFYLNCYHISKDESIIEKLSSVLTRFTNKAEESNSSRLLSEVYLFKSQIALIDLDVETAKLLLNKAQDLAEEKGIYKLANLISNTYDTLIENMHFWESATFQLPQISDRMELSHIEDLLHKLVSNKIIYNDITLEKEQPVMFLIIDLDGSIVFSEMFSDGVLAEDDIKGILRVIKSADDSKVSPNNIIERLKSNDYSILYSQFRNFSFCYVYYGRSYAALKKFRKMLEQLQNSKQFFEALDDLSYFPTIEKRIDLTELLDNIFLK